MDEIRKCRKKKYSIEVRRGYPGQVVYNITEDSRQTVTDECPFILTGLLGEEWCVDMTKLLKSYDITEERAKALTGAKVLISTKDDPGIMWAKLRPIEDGEFQVQAQWAMLFGNRPGIEHEKGDMQMYADKDGQPNMDDSWIVNGCVFALTYEYI